MPARPAEKSSALDEAVTERVRALPGTLTFLDLIRKNKRDSILLIGLMLVLNTFLGAVMGGAAISLFGSIGEPVGFWHEYADTAASAANPENAVFIDQRLERTAERAARAPLTMLGLNLGVYGDGRRTAVYVVAGAVVMMLLTAGTAAWSWFNGGKAIMRMVHARVIAPEQDPVLYNVVDEMRLAAGIPMPKIYIIPDTALNAFATGRDPEHGIVAITSGLREKLTRDELQGVMAHEIAHIRHLDIRFSMLMAMLVGLIVVACDVLLRVGFYGGVRAGGRRGGRGSGGSGGGSMIAIMFLLIAIVLSVVAPLLAKMIQMAYSRKREYLADAGAVELTRNPRGLASALRKLAEDTEPLVETANRGTAHMFIMNPLRRAKQAAAGKRGRNSRHNRSSIFSSHPPVAERIARLMALDR
ncbi:MAG: M48 family metallopeptidase [Planctomycetota bacterium]